MKQPIDLKNIDRETQILYAGVVTFGSQTAYDLTGIKLSDNEAFGRLFTGHLLRRIVRDIVQTPEKSTDIEIALFPAGLHYSWNIGDEKFEITSHDTNAIPNTISISYDNLLLTHPVGAVKTKSTVRGITLAHQPYTDRAQWRKYRGALHRHSGDHRPADASRPAAPRASQLRWGDAAHPALVHRRLAADPGAAVGLPGRCHHPAAAGDRSAGRAHPDPGAVQLRPGLLAQSQSG